MREYEFGTRIFIFRSIQYYFLYHCKEFIFDNATPNIFCLVHRNSWNSLLHSQTDSAKVLAINIFLVMTDRETSGISGSICTFFFFPALEIHWRKKGERERGKKWVYVGRVEKNRAGGLVKITPLGVKTPSLFTPAFSLPHHIHPHSSLPSSFHLIYPPPHP